jgi:exodeoxyribonuclease-5
MTLKNEILSFLHFHTPTSEQKSALEGLSSFVDENASDDFFILSGAAGTGKTSITSALIGYLNEIKVAYKIAAPTGRAARILGKKSKTVSNTIHSLIYNTETNVETGVTTWKLKKMRSDAYTIFIVDEASMISSKVTKQEMYNADDSLLSNLLKYIKSGNPKNKVIFLGDKNQLPPYSEIDSLALDPNHLRSKYHLKGSFHYLTEVKRVEDGSYILKNATKLRKSIDENSPLPELEANLMKHVWDAAKEYAKEFDPSNFEKSVAIGRSHKANNKFNEEVRKSLFGSAAPLIVTGDLLIVLQNWRRGDKTLYNGDHILIEDIDLSKVEEVRGIKFVPAKIKAQALDGTFQIIEDYLMLDTLLYEDSKIPFTIENEFRAERFRKNKVFASSANPEDDRYVGAIRIGYGYAITCQKAQGGEWDKVYLNVFGVQDKKWLYTAVTRAKQELNVYGLPK